MGSAERRSARRAAARRIRFSNKGEYLRIARHSHSRRRGGSGPRARARRSGSARPQALRCGPRAARRRDGGPGDRRRGSADRGARRRPRHPRLSSDGDRRPDHIRGRPSRHASAKSGYGSKQRKSPSPRTSGTRRATSSARRRPTPFSRWGLILLAAARSAGSALSPTSPSRRSWRRLAGSPASPAAQK